MTFFMFLSFSSLLLFFSGKPIGDSHLYLMVILSFPSSLILGSIFTIFGWSLTSDDIIICISIVGVGVIQWFYLWPHLARYIICRNFYRK